MTEPIQKPEYAIKRKNQLYFLTLLLRGISILLIPLLLAAMIYRNNQHIPPLLLIIITSIGFGLLFYTAYIELSRRLILFLSDVICVKDSNGNFIQDPTEKKGINLVDPVLRDKWNFAIKLALALPGWKIAYESDIRFHFIIYASLSSAALALFAAIGWIELTDTSLKILGLGLLCYSLTVFINMNIIIYRMGLRRASDDIDDINDVDNVDNVKGGSDHE